MRKCARYASDPKRSCDAELVWILDSMREGVLAGFCGEHGTEAQASGLLRGVWYRRVPESELAVPTSTAKQIVEASERE